MAYRLYILMRVDLPSMNPGKAMAQAAHAANLLVWTHGKKAKVQEWLNQANGFGTTIVLAATKEQISRAVCKATMAITGLVFDPTYPYILNSEIAGLIDPEHNTGTPIVKDNGQVVLFRKELTCGYIFLAEDDPSKDELVGDLPLHY